MGVTNLSRKLRNSKDKPDKLANSEVVRGLSIGVDLSVICHKALNINDGAGEFHMKPPCPNSEVRDKCTKICALAKSNGISLKISVDGKYHPMKQEENEKRHSGRAAALAKLMADLKVKDLGEKKNVNEVFRDMKKATSVTPEIISTAVEVFKQHGMEVYGAPFESDFQLVYWELIGFTQGTFTTDSDIFAMGSDLVVDLLDLNSAYGNCKILQRGEVQKQIMDGSEHWTTQDVILYSALSGCDFIPRLFRMKTESIEKFMRKYKDPSNTESLNDMLASFSTNQHWPAGNNKPGKPATNYVEMVNFCVGLMMHAPVIDLVPSADEDDPGEYKIIPMRALPDGKDWKDVIGLDPHEHFSGVSVEESYKMEIWARTETKLPVIEQPQDPSNTSRTLPHGAYIDFNHLPIAVVPGTMLLLWLYYHGIPHPKGSSRYELVQQVTQAHQMGQELDEDRLTSVEAATAGSYISFDTILLLLPDTEWIADGDTLLSNLRGNSVAKITANYVNDIFGLGKNGIRERAWLRLVSGHLNIDTLKMANAKVELDGKEEDVKIFMMEVTPSMKNVVYNVYIVFTSDGVYVPKLSKCDCPNGWLFCSHTLACFMLFYLIQKEDSWTFEDVISFMPVPIKSLQSVPFAASYVFGELEVSKVSKAGGKEGTNDNERGYVSAIARGIARDVPGYSESTSRGDDDAIEESRIILEDAQSTEDVKSIDLCTRMDDYLKNEKQSVGGDTKENKAKVTLKDLTDYNLELVNGNDSDETILRKYIRHERLYGLMKDGYLSKDNSMWYYLHHFATEREEHINRLTGIVDVNAIQLEPGMPMCNTPYLSAYFSDDDDDN